MIKNEKIFSKSFILILSVFLGFAPISQAVMRPGKVEKDLKVRNHLSQATLEQHMNEATEDIPEVLPKFLIPVASQLVLSGQNDFIWPEQVASHILDSTFYMMFKSLPAKRFQIFDKIYSEAESSQIDWVASLGTVLPSMSLTGLSKELSSMRLVDFEYLDAENMRLKIPKEFKEFPVLQKFLRLIGLLRLEAHIQLIEYYGGLQVLRENYPKIRLLEELYSSYAMFEIGMKIFTALGREYELAEVEAGQNQSDSVEWRQFQVLLKGLSEGQHMMYHGIWVAAYQEELQKNEVPYGKLYTEMMLHLSDRHEELLKSNQVITCGLALSDWTPGSSETRH